MMLAWSMKREAWMGGYDGVSLEGWEGGGGLCR